MHDDLLDLVGVRVINISVESLAGINEVLILSDCGDQFVLHGIEKYHLELVYTSDISEIDGETIVDIRSNSNVEHISESDNLYIPGNVMDILWVYTTIEFDTGREFQIRWVGVTSDSEGTYLEIYKDGGVL